MITRTPRRGLDEHVIATFRTILTDLAREGPIRASGGTGEDRRRSYLACAMTAGNHLRTVVTADERARVVLTDRYRMFLTVGLGDHEMNGLVDLELDDRLTVWRAVVATAQAWRTRWADAGIAVVADTNVFLHHEHLFAHIDWHELIDAQTSVARVVHLVVPLLVVDELDKRNRRSNNNAHTRVRVRDTLKLFDALLADGRDRVELRRSPQRVTVEVLVDELDHERLSDNDNELIDRARLLADLVHPAPEQGFR